MKKKWETKSFGYAFWLDSFLFLLGNERERERESAKRGLRGWFAAIESHSLTSHYEYGRVVRERERVCVGGGTVIMRLLL